MLLSPQAQLRSKHTCTCARMQQHLGRVHQEGDSNCSYFKFFTTGENAHIFQRTTHKGLNITAAVMSLLSITLMVMGSICITMALSKGVEFLLKPASFFFILSGTFVLVTMVIFREAVRWLMASNQNVPLEYEYSWSVACAAAAGAILIFGGGCCMLLAMPALPKKPWEYCLKKGSSS
ncbi:hypothetical protein FKM82_013438 [Ascaphus truei]